jgi:hypothetical protein
VGLDAARSGARALELARSVVGEFVKHGPTGRTEGHKKTWSRFHRYQPQDAQRIAAIGFYRLPLDWPTSSRLAWKR